MKIFKNIIFWLATVLVSVAIILVALPMIGNLDYLTIISGSMEPEIPVGSLVIIEPVKQEEIKVGDVITFQSSGEMSVTHKVIGYELKQDALITHGIANDEGVNEITPYDSVIGRVVFTVPIIGRAVTFISTTRGKVIAATVILALYIVSVFFETLGSRSGDSDPEDDLDPLPGGDPPKGKKPKRKQRRSAKREKFEPSLGAWLDGL